jgi:ferrous iron transport protein A
MPNLRHRHRWGRLREAETLGRVTQAEEGLLSLEDLAPGQTARIQGYTPGNPAYRSKLLAMGLTRGTALRVLQVAPMGDPIEVEVRGFNLSLRKHEARVLLLRREGA